MENIREQAIDATRAAGAVIMGFYQDSRSFDITDKTAGDKTENRMVDNPVTDADYASDQLLNQRLMEILPEAGWLSEETVDNPSRLEKEYVWVVDPLDGTREFVQGIPEWTVSVALVQNGDPVLGIIFNPSSGEMFVAERGKGTAVNGQPAQITEQSTLTGATIDASRSERKRGEFASFEDRMEIRTMGSIAYKLARVASGDCDATWSRGPKHEWDICAGVLLIQEAGGVCVDLDGGRIQFNKAKPKVPGIIGDNGHLHAEIMQEISALGAARVGDQRA